MSTSTTSTWFTTARDALTLKPEPYRRLAFGKASIRPAITIVVVVGLIIGLAAALVALPGLLQSPADAVDDVFTGIEDSLQQFQLWGGQLPPETDMVLDMVKQNIESMRPFVQDIVNLPTPLPPFFSRLFEWLGALISSPFALLAKWLGISLWIMFFARLLGGRGGMVHYLNASSLSVIPHLLSIFAFIPCGGAVLALIGSIWGLAMQYKAVQVTHGFSQGRALAAVLLPYLLILLAIGLLIIAGVLIALAGGGFNAAGSN